MATEPPLPLSVDDISAEWLAHALSSAGRDVGIEEAEINSVIWGTATKVLLSVTYTQHGAGLPRQLCLKGGFTPEMRQKMNSIYQAEALFYRDMAPRLSAGLPSCYFADFDEITGQAVIIMNDLRDQDAQFLGPGESLTPEQAASGLAFLADLHAQDTSGESLTGSPQNLRKLAYTVVLTPETWSAGMAANNSDLVRDALHDRDHYLRSLTQLWKLEDASPVCLTHGDANATNVFVSEGSFVTFIDWQFVAKSDWAHDVAFFLISTLSSSARRDHELELLHRYMTKRAELGAPVGTWERAWKQYRQHAVYGLIYAVTPDELQPNAVRAPIAERFADAVLQHQAYDLLGV